MHMEFRTVKESGNVRIIELADPDIDIDNLKGDSFNPKANPDIPKTKLKAEERAFERRVIAEGVWGYEVQRWNPEVNKGWETLDAIWGFVGNDFEGSGYDTEFMKHFDGQNKGLK